MATSKPGATGTACPHTFAGQTVTVRSAWTTRSRSSTASSLRRLAPASSSPGRLGTVPEHHAALWQETLGVERRSLEVYEEVGAWN